MRKFLNVTAQNYPSAYLKAVSDMLVTHFLTSLKQI